jgi:hypothetical protein
MSIGIEMLFPNWEKEVFVFGSNLRGRHEAGAALDAQTKYGATPGFYEGPMASCYAIPTKDEYMNPLTLGDIETSIAVFVIHAALNVRHKFLVTQVGCGFAGYTPKNIAPMFSACLMLDNVFLPLQFLKILVANPYNYRISYE